MNKAQGSGVASRRGFLLGVGAAATAVGLAGWGAPVAVARQNQPNAARAAGAPAALEVIELDKDLKVVTGAGGNIAVHTSADSVFVIDAGVPNRAADVVAAVTAVAGASLAGGKKMLFNTHYHFDHVGANELMAAAGFTIVGSTNCRRRNGETIKLEDLGMTAEPLPERARQSVTFGDGGMSLYVPDEVRLVKFPASHTDTDAVAMFTKHNVLHTGDLFFNKWFPVIDRATGGSLEGMIAATKLLIGMCNPQTRIIPGHGVMAKVEDLVKTLAMLEEVKVKFAPFVAKKATIDEVLAAKPLASMDDAWGRGFLRSEVFTKMAYPR